MIHVKAHKNLHIVFLILNFFLIAVVYIVICMVLNLNKLDLKKITMRFKIFQAKELIVAKIATFRVKNLPDLLQSSSVFGSATRDTETVSTRTLVSTF